MYALARIIAGVLGAFGLLVAAVAFAAPARLGAQLGLEPVGAVGVASLRADVGAFFIVCGGFALAAAITRRAWLMTATTVALAAALCGRAITFALDGGGEAAIRLMAVEVVLLAAALFAQWRLKKT